MYPYIAKIHHVDTLSSVNRAQSLELVLFRIQDRRLVQDIQKL